MACWDEIFNLMRQLEGELLRLQLDRGASSWRVVKEAEAGWYSRAYLADRLPAEIARSRRSGRPFGLGLFRLDQGELVPAAWRPFLQRALQPEEVAVLYGDRALCFLFPEQDGAGVRRRTVELADEAVVFGLFPRDALKLSSLSYPEVQGTPGSLLSLLEETLLPLRAVQGEGAASGNPSPAWSWPGPAEDAPRRGARGPDLSAAGLPGAGRPEAAEEDGEAGPPGESGGSGGETPASAGWTASSSEPLFAPADEGCPDGERMLVGFAGPGAYRRPEEDPRGPDDGERHEQALTEEAEPEQLRWPRGRERAGLPPEALGRWPQEMGPRPGATGRWPASPASRPGENGAHGNRDLPEAGGGLRRERESGPVNGRVPVAVGFAPERALPVSFWYEEELYTIDAVLNEEKGEGAHRMTVVTGQGTFLLERVNGQWFAKKLADD